MFVDIDRVVRRTTPRFRRAHFRTTIDTLRTRSSDRRKGRGLDRSNQRIVSRTGSNRDTASFGKGWTSGFRNDHEPNGEPLDTNPMGRPFFLRFLNRGSKRSIPSLREGFVSETNGFPYRRVSNTFRATGLLLSKRDGSETDTSREGPFLSLSLTHTECHRGRSPSSRSFA